MSEPTRSRAVKLMQQQLKDLWIQENDEFWAIFAQNTAEKAIDQSTVKLTKAVVVGVAIKVIGWIR